MFDNDDDTGKSLRTLQRDLPWGANEYNAAFQRCERQGRDFEHAVLHIQKALGKLAGVCDDCEHDLAPPGIAQRVTTANALADVVICAIRAARTLPGGEIDLAQAVADRLAEKFPVRAR